MSLIPYPIPAWNTCLRGNEYDFDDFSVSMGGIRHPEDQCYLLAKPDDTLMETLMAIFINSVTKYPVTLILNYLDRTYVRSLSSVHFPRLFKGDESQLLEASVIVFPTFDSPLANRRGQCKVEQFDLTLQPKKKCSYSE